MIWTVRCKKCFSVIENSDKSVEVSLEGKRVLMTLRAFCHVCNISSIYEFTGTSDESFYRSSRERNRKK